MSRRADAVARLRLQAWAHWAVVLLCCGLGILAHGVSSNVLTAAHAGLGIMLGAALGAWDTAFWFTLDGRCETVQAAFVGCGACACAGANACMIADLSAGGACPHCTAYPTEVCDAVARQYNNYLLAFTGLTAVVSLALPAVYSLLVLLRQVRADTEQAAMLLMVAFAVDQQTTLVCSGDKPTITPAMLAEWVGFLLDSEDPPSEMIAEKQQQRVGPSSTCLLSRPAPAQALADRGYDLPVVRRAVHAGGGKQGHKKKKSRAPSESGGNAGPAVTHVLVHAGGGFGPPVLAGSPVSAATVPPAVSIPHGDAYAAVEGGFGRRKI
eukprot:scaffold17.g551.t1